MGHRARNHGITRRGDLIRATQLSRGPGATLVCTNDLDACPGRGRCVYVTLSCLRLRFADYIRRRDCFCMEMAGQSEVGTEM